MSHYPILRSESDLIFLCLYYYFQISDGKEQLEKEKYRPNYVCRQQSPLFWGSKREKREELGVSCCRFHVFFCLFSFRQVETGG